MKKWMMALTGVCLMLGLGWACVARNEETVYPRPAGCDTSLVRYSVEITQIIASNCLECHSAARANAQGGGNNLEGYANLRNYTTGGFLQDVVNHRNGASPMPKGRPKLDPCSLRKIDKWIAMGAPNN